jgi:hypothetical protein
MKVFYNMAIMEYNQFKQIFNETIFEKSKSHLLTKVAEEPHRYIGIFRPTKPKGKILQNLLQSNEIRFGDAFEIIIEKYLKTKECKILNKNYEVNGKKLNIDQCFQINNKIYFIEQKVRDDHDSTKKRGQHQNFDTKVDIMIEKHGENNLVGIVYFIDPSLKKNKKYLSEELNSVSNDYNVECHLFYGKELFTFLNYEDVWNEINDYLVQWRSEIPELPIINFDIDAINTFSEIKDLRPSVFRNLFSNDEIFKEIILTLFPEKTTLKLLLNYFSQKPETIYRTIADGLAQRISC